MMQLSIDFDPPPRKPRKEGSFARTTDPITSHEAAMSVDVSALEQIVLEVIIRFPFGCIADDLENALPGYRSHSITPRIKPLLQKGLLIETGETRRALSGRQQRVVIAAWKPAPY